MKPISKKLSLSLFFLFAAVLFCVAPAGTAYAEKPYVSCSPKEIHPIYWKATIRGNVRVKIKETKQYVTIDHGTEVIVTKYQVKGKNTVMLKDGRHFNVSAGNLNIYDDACTPGDFKRSTKTAFVNSRSLKSKTDWMIWVSTDRQSLNVFRGYNHHWTLVKRFNCSTGMANWSTPLGRKTVRHKFQSVYSEQFESTLYYFLEFGGSGIHKWPGPNARDGIGKKPCSHACVRVYKRPAIWLYKHIPVGTLLYVY